MLSVAYQQHNSPAKSRAFASMATLPRVPSELDMTVERAASLLWRSNAKELGVSHTTYKAYCSGKTTVPVVVLKYLDLKERAGWLDKGPFAGAHLDHEGRLTFP
ncbi:hypothetical protein Ga0061063_2090 [Gulbenkiania indica]|uniref:Uncharacterized protein n=2 Tax=Gulbenkiania indica TaxID=375574 RepID=A0A0K6H114_9NEIS|nr:hypothetical protein Ga0061063_2090 [Gulbenkiania indica]